jgi:hypothetical protein
VGLSVRLVSGDSRGEFLTLGRPDRGEYQKRRIKSFSSIKIDEKDSQRMQKIMDAVGIEPTTFHSQVKCDMRNENH